MEQSSRDLLDRGPMDETEIKDGKGGKERPAIGVPEEVLGLYVIKVDRKRLSVLKRKEK